MVAASVGYVAVSLLGKGAGADLDVGLDFDVAQLRAGHVPAFNGLVAESVRPARRPDERAGWFQSA